MSMTYISGAFPISQFTLVALGDKDSVDGWAELFPEDIESAALDPTRYKDGSSRLQSQIGRDLCSWLTDDILYRAKPSLDPRVLSESNNFGFDHAQRSIGFASIRAARPISEISAERAVSLYQGLSERYQHDGEWTGDYMKLGGFGPIHIREEHSGEEERKIWSAWQGWVAGGLPLLWISETHRLYPELDIVVLQEYDFLRNANGAFEWRMASVIDGESTVVCSSDYLPSKQNNRIQDAVAFYKESAK